MIPPVFPHPSHQEEALEALMAGALSSHQIALEMERGTGSTYCAVRFIFELHRRRGQNRFVFLVPSQELKARVLDLLENAADHLCALYQRRARFFGYDPRQLHRLRAFELEGGISLMVATSGELSSSRRDHRLFFQVQDRFQSRSPQEVISSARPVVLFMEPHQKSAGSVRAALELLQPSQVLLISSIHRQALRPVYRLDARAARERELLKPLEVVQARDACWTSRISRVIEVHLRRERALFSRGIKVLSLIFLDDAELYSDARDPREPGPGLAFFRKEYRRQRWRLLKSLATNDPYGAYLRSLATTDTARGYFPRDPRTGFPVNPKPRRGGLSAASGCTDITVLEEILRDRRRLCGLEEPERFLFTHASLREGWEHPNVFVIARISRVSLASRLGPDAAPLSRRDEASCGWGLALDQEGVPRFIADAPLTLVVAPGQVGPVDPLLDPAGDSGTNPGERSYQS